MPYKSKQEGGVSKGKPSQTEKDKAATKEVDDEKLDRNEEMREKYADKVDIKHRNRNTNKPDIDKPAYGSSK